MTTRDRIIDEFARWIASCAVGSDAIVHALDSVEFDALFRADLGRIGDAEFAAWHETAVDEMRRVQPGLEVGLAAKAINECLKTKCYLGGYGRDGLIDRIHPPIDDGLIRGLQKGFANNADMRESLDSLEPMKRIDTYAKYANLIRVCKRAAALSGCSLMEVEIFWD